MINDKLIRWTISCFFPTILLLLLCNGCQDTNLKIDALPFQDDKGEGWGLIGTDGQIKVACGTFTQQPSAVVNGMFSLPNKEGHYQLYQIDNPQQPVSARCFSQIGYFFEDVTLAQESPDSPILIINRKGENVNDIGTSLHYDIVMAHNFCEGRALFCTREGKYGFMDTQGKIVIPPLYDQAYDFNEELALAGNANTNGEMSFRLIDWNGYICLPIQNAPSVLDQQFSNGLLMYTNGIDRKCCYLDKRGKTTIYLPDNIRDAYRFKHHAAIVQSMYGTGLINEEGEQLIAPEYEDGVIAGDNRVCLKKNGQWRLYDFKGRLVSSAAGYDQITAFYPSGLAIACRNGRFAWMDRDGKLINNKQYATIVTDASALQPSLQVFVRRNNDGTKNVNEVEMLNAEAPLVVADKKMYEKSLGKYDTKTPSLLHSSINSQGWKNIGKQSPFYAEANKILSGKLSETDAENRRMILNYVEHLRTSYTTKDIDFLTQLFSEDALIIVGTIIRNAPKMEGQYLSHEQVVYNVKSKQSYLERLKVLFKKNKEIKVRFSDFKVLRHPTVEGLYGVTLRQKYSSDLYSDDGYLFLLWDFRDVEAPLIHVRTWQPSMLNDQTPLPEKDIFNIQNFNLQ